MPTCANFLKRVAKLHFVGHRVRPQAFTIFSAKPIEATWCQYAVYATAFHRLGFGIVTKKRLKDNMEAFLSM
jgi:hypothetical protein